MGDNEQPPDALQLFALAMTAAARNGLYRHESPYYIRLDAQIVYEVDGPLLSVYMEHKPREGAEDAEVVKTLVIQFPANLMPPLIQQDFIKRVDELFKTSLREALQDESVLLLADSVHRVIADMRLEPTHKREIVKAHVRATTERLRRWLGIKSKGRVRQWTALDLSRAVQGVLREIPPGVPRDYNAVAERLHEIYGDRAPQSGNALRVLMDRLEIGDDWRRWTSEQ